jgi:hypothetical protein
MPTPWPTGSGLGAWSEHTTCAPAGGEGLIVFTFTGVWDSESGAYPNFITIDGSNVAVRRNPFEQPEAVGDHSYVLNIASSFTIVACAVPVNIAVATACSSGVDDGAAAFSGVTVGDLLFIDSGASMLINANPFVDIGLNTGLHTFTEGQPNDGSVTTVFAGSFRVAACAVVTPKPAHA